MQLQSENFHDLLSVSGGPGKAVTCLQPKPEAREPGALTYEGRRWVSQLKQQVNLPFLCLSVLFGPPAD